jgi:DnaK suppressor protein
MMMEVSTPTTKRNTGVSKANNENKIEAQLPINYQPSEREEFMNPNQTEYFRQKLLRWRAELLDEANQTIANLSTESLHRPDQMDRAQIESNAALDLRTRDRERKLLQKIEAALRRIEDGSYGYCEETGEAISVSRLEARPIAALSLHAQEMHERMERVHRDD